MEFLAILYFIIGIFVIWILTIFLGTVPIIIIFVIYFIFGVLLFIACSKIQKKIEQSDEEVERNKTINEDLDEEYYETETEPKKKSFLETIEESKKKERAKPRYTDKDLADYGLEDWQKDLVNKGEYEPWNFEEEDLDEDDYYYDDDK